MFSDCTNNGSPCKSHRSRCDAGSRRNHLFVGRQRPHANGQKLFAAARRMRTRYFGNGVFLYGFVYFSTYCKNECRFCHYRQSNARITRYRKTDETIIAISCRLKAAGVHLIDLTMGEDPFYVDHAPEGNHRLIDIRPPCQKCHSVAGDGLTRRDLRPAPGGHFRCRRGLLRLLSRDTVKGLYNHLRSGQDFETRLRSKSLAKSARYADRRRRHDRRW
jgi:methylornithine synthase